MSPAPDSALADELDRARRRTLGLVDDLDESDQTAQHSRLMSPLVWDLAHVGNYEELWLVRQLDGRDPVDERLDWMYNAFEHPRWSRPDLPLLGPTEARAYVSAVRGEVLALLERRERLAPVDARLLEHDYVYGMVLQHEHQHAETMLATRQLMGERAPAVPGATTLPPSADRPAGPTEVHLDGGEAIMGTDEEPWAYDNERGSHRVQVEPFAVDRWPVTNRGFLAFVDSGGYHDERLWLPAGWRARHDDGYEAPGSWSPDGGGGWTLTRFGRVLPLAEHLDEPVQHVSWFEADAFARWAGKRLPTEAEWEFAATWDPAAGKRRYPWGDAAPDPERANLGQRHDGPLPAGSLPAGASPCGVEQLIGDVWEWTSSDFLPYPGFEAWPYEEYSQVFWGPDYKVLRGGSWAADPVAVRGTFRNWDFPIRRQIFAGFRCARSL